MDGGLQEYPRQAMACQGGSGGTYWIRTSDPYLVEVVL